MNESDVLNKIKDNFKLNNFFSSSHINNIEKCIDQLYCTIKFKTRNETIISINVFLSNNNVDNYKENYYSLIDGKKCIIKFGKYHWHIKNNVDLIDLYN
ncbi:hypothetical protein JYG23_03045 [Sedimentibacter sp. zth1]|uniref:hypothetical protein n=1 Tax=Sedimentibacter sp. zth1 TaxID=2816908 RepID=UPI001A912381|nr:hypothetical protein [Sedimentibacter sp. zth1]QSX06451.1 hypothetical protein JYG23_03045 [Sedimentibacter sp. zth1]